MNWTRDQLLLALNLYFQTPFGKQHQAYPPIIELAKKIGRTPGAVAMKLNNLTSLDPAELERGIVGLRGASKLDREIWSEFAADRNDLAAESERLLEDLYGGQAKDIDLDDSIPPLGLTEMQTFQKSRLQQRYFRRTVLASYGNRCCVSGLPVPALLRASHIVPWAESEEHRMNPRNGLCLAATFDAAFDRGLISFDDNFRLLLGDQFDAFADNEEVRVHFGRREGTMLTLPGKNLPELDLLAIHRNRWGYS